MHRYTKTHSAWVPTVTKKASVVSADPRLLLEAEVDRFCTPWTAEDHAECVVVPDRDSLPRAPAVDIRAAAFSFPEATSQSLDGTHPRQLGLLSDEGLDTLSANYDAMGSAGMPP